MPDARMIRRDPSPEDNEESPAETRDKLRLSRTMLSTVLRLTEDTVIVLDRHGIVIDVSANTRELLGIDLDEVIGRARWEDFVPDDEKERLTGYFNDRARGTGNPPTTYTLRVLVPGGQRFMRANVDFVPGTEDRVVILKDLSDVVKEQKRTAESEERYRTVIENTMDGILICTMDRILFANTSFCNMTGLPREEIYSLPPMRFFHEADRARLEPLFRGGGPEGKSTQVLETSVRKKQGFLPAELSATPMIYRNIEAMLISVRDLTQRRETERQLKEQHNLLKAIVDNSPVGVSVYDRHGTLLMANASWRAIWGKSTEDLKERMIPRSELRMNSGDSYLGNYLKDVEIVYREGGELYIPILKISNPPPGGAEFISHHFYALMDDEGKVDKVVILTLDLTESLRTKDELRETRDMYRDLFSNIPVAVYRTTLEAGGRLVSANPEMLRMFLGDEDADFSRISVRDLYVHAARRQELMRKLASDEEVRGFETELRRVDGSTFLGSISARKVPGGEGGPNYIEGIIRDITDQRRMEEELANIEHLESIGTLAGGIAHDFNNLLMAIQGGISLAREETEPARIALHLKETEESVKEATSLTRQLLTFSRGGVPVKGSVDVETCIRDAVLFSLRGSEVEARFDFQDGLDRISADREQIAQVIQNMTLNSVQAMPGGGRITVKCSSVVTEPGDEEGLKPGKYVIISLKDEGCGIPAADRKRIFNPYYTTKPDGTGLGLPTSYSIVKRHSGAIRVFSEENKGTEFMIFLPVAEEHEKKEKDCDRRARGTAESSRILVMDDDRKVREVLCSMLEALGHRVTECTDGNQAVELYGLGLSSGEPYRAVIMDLTVPGGMGGEAAIDRLRKLDPGVRAIVSSGYANNPVLSSCSEYGFSGSLVKPFSLFVLREELNSVLSEEEP